MVATTLDRIVVPCALDVEKIATTQSVGSHGACQTDVGVLDRQQAIDQDRSAIGIASRRVGVGVVDCCR